MKASIVDFRTKSHQIIQAINRSENIELFYHGKLKAVIKPVPVKSIKAVQDSNFFGCLKNENEPVNKTMKKLRRNPRYDF